MPIWFTSRILWNLRQIHKNISLYKENVFLLTCTCHSLSKIHFRKATPEIPAWTMLYEFKGFFVIHSFWRLTLLILDLILHCRWSIVYFFTIVQWIRNAMFLNVVYAILRCRTSCIPRNFVPIQLNLPIILIVHLVSFNKQYILAFADRLGF